MVDHFCCTGSWFVPLNSGTLVVAPVLSPTYCLLRAIVARLAIPYTEPSPQVLAIPLIPGRLEVLCEGWGRELSLEELRETRALWLAPGSAVTLATVRDTQPLQTLIAKVRRHWLAPMIRDGRLTTHFQPIVRVTNPGEVFAHECLLRGRSEDGSTVPPGTLFDAAREAGLVFELDRVARLASIREAIAQGLVSRLFINFNASAVEDPMHCLRGTVRAIEDAGIDPSRVVFEVVESDRSPANLIEIIATYRRAGFRIALDDLGSGYGSLSLLASLRPDFIKLDMKLIQKVDRDTFRAGITETLLAMAQRLGIETVAEGVETAGEWAWIRDHGADYAQGFYIAQPANPPPIPFAHAGGPGPA